MVIEQRRFIRVDRAIRVRYQLQGKEERYDQALTKNIGGMGLCLLLDAQLPVGSFLKLTLDIPGASKPIETGAKVVWIDKAEKTPDGFKADFEAGLKFTSLSSKSRASIVEFVFESLKRRELS
jgi:c-di-GMP-binding flagellar brake protein YcgR